MLNPLVRSSERTVLLTCECTVPPQKWLPLSSGYKGPRTYSLGSIDCTKMYNMTSVTNARTSPPVSTVPCSHRTRCL